MIATLQGEVLQVEAGSIILAIGGVGLRVSIPLPAAARLKVGDRLMLHTHLVVRQDALQLYGFETRLEQELFNLLLGVDGVGPRLALAVLSNASLEVVQRAVQAQDPDLLGRIPGVGRKTAQKIILHLHDRLKLEGVLGQVASLSDVDAEVLAALTTLGYSIVEAQTAIQSIPAQAPDGVEERLRIALQNIGD